MRAKGLECTQLVLNLELLVGDEDLEFEQTKVGAIHELPLLFYLLINRD
jgi:hypothetical protein